MTDFSRVLIDGDILVYRIGFTTQDVDEEIARWRLDELLEKIMYGCNTQNSRIYLTSTDRSNFRFQLYPDYKAQRKDKPKPVHYAFLRKTLEQEYMAEVVHEQEADDALGIALSEDASSILATIDKDLDQIPGWHFNFVKEQIYQMSEIEAWRSFYMQCLVGDKATDNVEGCPGIGIVKATRSLEGCESESEMFEAVTRLYLKAYSTPEVASTMLWLAGNLLWVRRKENQSWVRPNGDLVSKTALKHFLLTQEWDTSTNQTLSNTSSQKQSTDTPLISNWTEETSF